MLECQQTLKCEYVVQILSCLVCEEKSLEKKKKKVSSGLYVVTLPLHMGP